MILLSKFSSLDGAIQDPLRSPLSSYAIAQEQFKKKTKFLESRLRGESKANYLFFIDKAVLMVNLGVIYLRVNLINFSKTETDMDQTQSQPWSAAEKSLTPEG